MLFSSPLFLFQFLPLVLLAYYALDRGLRNTVLLVASLFFYAWGEPVMVGLMLLSCLSNWGFGLWVERARERGGAKRVIAWATVFNLGLLVAFKYSDWLWTSASSALMALGWLHQPLPLLSAAFEPDSFWTKALFTADGHIRLPIGISFFTFQAFSYVIDVYRRDADVQKNPASIALYVSLFPQLIAGPIVRYKDVAEQIVQRSSTWPAFAYGVRRFVLGLGKKMLIANAVAGVADEVFKHAGEVSTPVAWIGVVAYTLQIYFDFSGYSDMAIGLGHMFGFHFLENFDHPYVARSVTEFWRRWHMSLSTWFRDYLYIPLGGNRVSPQRTYLNLWLVFFLCGLWHGASATFVVWGLYHGTFLVLERMGLGRWLALRPAALRHAYLLLVVMIGWVFFKAADFAQAAHMLVAMAGFGADSALQPLGLYVDAYSTAALFAGVVGSTPWMPALEAWHRRRLGAGWTGQAVLAETLGLVFVLLVLAASSMALASNSYNPFIYFRF